jgi:hypothetical protein
VSRRPANRDDAVLAEVMQTEWQWVAARRRASELTPRRAMLGLALSGGGIRSATFSLGILQALSRNKLIKQIDYTSTVSGGSYVGSFFGALYVEPSLRHAAESDLSTDKARADFRDKPLQSPRGRKAVARLREFGRYLTPGGFSDTMYGASLMARNWVSLQLVLGLAPLLLFLLVGLIERPASWLFFNDQKQGALYQSVTWADETPVSWVLSGMMICAGLWSAALATGFWYSRREKVDKSLFQRIGTSAIVLGAVAVAALLAMFGVWPLAREVGFDCWHQAINPVRVARLASPEVGCRNLLERLWAGFPLVASTVTLLLSIAAYLGFAIQAQRRADKAIAPQEIEENVRGRMTRALATSNLVFVALVLLIVIDALAGNVAHSAASFPELAEPVGERLKQQEIYAALRVAWRNFWPLLVLVTPGLLTIWTHGVLRRGTGPGWLARPAGQAALGGSILFLWLVIWAAIAKMVPDGALIWVFLAVLIAFVIQLFCYGFLNLSSLVSLYALRLKRAYVGASNPTDSNQGFDVDRPGDHIHMTDYYSGVEGHLNQLRPVHLINCTIAQTEPEGNSTVVAYDRKGKPLHLSPAGIVHQHGGPGLSGQIAFDDAERLTLSSWTAVSGAAASTAIGSLTSLGLSILAMMANVRLGYWWRVVSDTSLWPKSIFGDTVIGYLFAELQGRFGSQPNKRKRWYLTDGGHFENTGAYALIQRRLDFIVVCDNGADPDYRLDDAVRLIDRARSDLNAEIEFYDVKDLDAIFGSDNDLRDAFGSYAALSRPVEPGSPARSPYAALARIRYDINQDPETATAQQASEPVNHDSDDHTPSYGALLLVKPRLNFTEPPELLAYQRREAGKAFPQQATLDQFFDEEQWEAYRRFGEVVGERIFASNGAGWSPSACLDGRAPVPSQVPGSGR